MSATYTYPTIATIVEVREETGGSNSANLALMFAYPTKLAAYKADPAAYKDEALGLLLGVDKVYIEENLQVGSFSRDYSDAPSYAVIADQLKAGAVAGPPASPWVPNPSSPGPGSIDPIIRPAAPTTGIYSSDTAAVTVPNGSNATSVITPARDPSKSSINMAKRVDTMQPPGRSPATINSGG